jgi:hypothetical protein
MMPYKRLFRESNQSIVSSESEAKTMVNISNLEWSPYMGRMTWSDAVRECPMGWRLPTVQELYTLYQNDENGMYNKEYYWSSSISNYDDHYAWYFDFLTGGADSYNKTNRCDVCYVKRK